MIKEENLEKTLFLWLSVIRSQGIGAKTFWRAYHQDPSFSNTPSKVSASIVAQEIAQHKTANCQLIHSLDPLFPELLKTLDDCPPVLSYTGNISLLQNSAAPIIAIVGARNASMGGLKIAYQLGYELYMAGYSVISGLARGIDGAAHQGSLDALKDKEASSNSHISAGNENSLLRGTIGVLAGGIDQIYPPCHKELYELMKKNGCVISEMAFGTPPSAPLFPKRNRFIASLCQGIIIIEAAHKSGTLITAKCALDLGKDVFVVPGSPLDPRSLGGNKLIKEGAILVESALDIIRYYEEWPYDSEKNNKKPTTQLPLSASSNSPDHTSASPSSPVSLFERKKAKTCGDADESNEASLLKALGVPAYTPQQNTSNSFNSVEYQNTDLLQTSPSKIASASGTLSFEMKALMSKEYGDSSAYISKWFYSLGIEPLSLEEAFELALKEAPSLSYNEFILHVGILEVYHYLTRNIFGEIQKNLCLPR